VARSAVWRRWVEAGEKLVTLADAIPESQYERRAADGTRSVAEQLRHVAFWNQYTAKALRGESPDGEANELPAARFATKAAIAQALTRSVSDVADAIAGASHDMTEAQRDTLASGLQHLAEHYGQLVVYARLAGITPPASRVG
jgi:uncharacterized damage-inducible protein DinB